MKWLGIKKGTLALNEDDQNFLETFSRQLRMCLNVWKNYTLSLPLAWTATKNKYNWFEKAFNYIFSKPQV